MLFDQDALRQALRRIVLKDRHRPLQDDGAGVHSLIVDEVHGAAGDFHPVFDGLPLRAQPGERGQREG